jgi:soluble lytic murein transglycosylase
MGKFLDTLRTFRLEFSPISRFRASCVLTSLALIAALTAGHSVYAVNLDEQFLAAEEAFRTHDIKALEFYAPALKDHLLADYPRYWLLQLTLKDTDPAQVGDFLSRYPDSPLAERLRIDWLKLLGQNEEWESFAAQFPKLKQEDTALTCYELQRRVAQGDKEAVKLARPLWFAGRSQPESCDPLFAQLLGENLLSSDDVWSRIRLAAIAGNVGVLSAANSYLPANEMIDMKAFDKARRAPSAYLAKKALSFKTRAAREIVIFSVLQIARKDHGQAAVHWSAMSPRFPENDQKDVWGQIGFHAAWAQDSAALSWFKKAGDGPLNDSQLSWKARAALRAQSWPDVLDAIEHMSSGEQQLATWRYWKARALKQQGKTNEARDLFLPLSEEFGFYGQLASEEIGTVINNPKEPWKPSADELKAMEESMGVKRALYLNRLGLWQDGVKEWNVAMRGLDDKQLLAASEIANRAGWFDRAIYSAEKTQTLHDFNLRYPTPFRNELSAGAKQNQLDEAWVYGIVRQESRFYSEAKSRVGAMGLMQLMPATARWIAQKLGISDFHTRDATTVDTNTAFGTYYLRHVLDDLGHPVLATAGYNGGPSRAARWRDVKPLEGAIYIESIPLSETRDYVKKVMSNATTYAGILGLKWQSLKDRLGLIPARSGATEEAIDLQAEAQ